MSARGKNAFGRAALTVARDLLELPDNRLSAIRDVGRRVTQEILGFRKAWLVAGPSLEGGPGPPPPRLRRRRRADRRHQARPRGARRPEETPASAP